MPPAGLWEFPSCLIAATDAEKAVRQAAVDACLVEWLGIESVQSTGSLKLVQRLQLETVQHTFSHIQQTMHVELLAFQVSSASACFSTKYM